MANSREILRLLIRGDARGLKRAVNSAIGDIRTFGRGARRALSRVNDAVFSLRGAFATLGVGLLARSFLDVGRTIETTRIRLEALTGSVQDANRAFDIMREFAGRVPFQFQEIVESSPLLLTVADDVEELNKLLQITGDIAVVSGLSFQETAQNIQRALGSGINSAELFRERGVSAMLGFEAGVATTAEETRQHIFDMWFGSGSATNTIRGATEQMAQTWDGAMSMLSDLWFQFRAAVMDEGLFDFLKAFANTVQSLLKTSFEESAGTAKSFSDTVVSGLRAGIRFGAIMANGVKVIATGITGANLVLSGFASTLLTLLDTAAQAFAAIDRRASEGANFAIRAFNRIPGVNIPLFDPGLLDNSPLLDSLSEAARASRERVSRLREDFSNGLSGLMNDALPSQQIDALLGRVDDALDSSADGSTEERVQAKRDDAKATRAQAEAEAERRRALEENREADTQLIADLERKIELERMSTLERQQAIAVDRLSADATDEQREAVRALVAELFQLQEAAEESGEEMSEFAVQGARNLQSEFADFLFDPFDEGLEGMVLGFANAMRRMIAEAAAAAILERIFPSSEGGLAGFFSSFLHEGGIAVPGGGSKRGVSPAAFISAPRFHGGGALGLSSDEVPAILQRGEEVITREDPRHRFNGGAGGGGSNVRIVNAIDPQAIADAMNSASGEEVILNTIGRNPGSVKRSLG
ncbi:MAG: hypothetical protein WD750_05760 [Gammaproteobacteria bacterium]